MIVHDYLGCVAWQYKLTTLRLFGTGAYTGFELQQAGGAVTGAHHVRRDIPVRGWLSRIKQFDTWIVLFD